MDPIVSTSSSQTLQNSVSPHPALCYARAKRVDEGVGIGQLEHLEIQLWLLIPKIRIGKGNAYISCFVLFFSVFSNVMLRIAYFNLV